MYLLPGKTNERFLFAKSPTKASFHTAGSFSPGIIIFFDLFYVNSVDCRLLQFSFLFGKSDSVISGATTEFKVLPP